MKLHFAPERSREIQAGGRVVKISSGCSFYPVEVSPRTIDRIAKERLDEKEKIVKGILDSPEGN